MSHPNSLEVIIKLAVEQRNAAILALGGSRRQAAEARQKFDMLSRYHREYLDRVSSGNRNGNVDAAKLANQRAFIEKLEQALEQQQRDTEASESYVNACFHKLRACEKKLKSMQTLSDRRDMEARRADNRQEQKNTDEFAANITRRRPPTFNFKSA